EGAAIAKIAPIPAGTTIRLMKGLPEQINFVSTPTAFARVAGTATRRIIGHIRDTYCCFWIGPFQLRQQSRRSSGGIL
ncbi:hypothetical protein, partial [Burkholderia sp. SIMBA_062]|uniref:hypothetical protein n=1 Tax=Burkholderia sp. SIMBA_062 TaxID=3085803 RepID=UPI00397A73BD